MTKAKPAPEPEPVTPEPESVTPEPEPVPPTPETGTPLELPPMPQLLTGTSLDTVGESYRDRWYLVTHGAWQISVGPDGLLMLPRHLHPREVADFIAAATDAAALGAWVIACNTLRGSRDDRSLPPARATVTAGGTPPGLGRMTVAGGPNAPIPQSAIGRRQRRSRPVAPPGARV